LSKAQYAALEAQSQLKESSLIIEGLRARMEEGKGRVEKKSFIDAAECKVLSSLAKPYEIPPPSLPLQCNYTPPELLFYWASLS
jgi:hypothetical protein